MRAVLVHLMCLSLLAAPLCAGSSDPGDRLRDPTTYGGVIGSLAGSVAATALAGALPGGLLAKAVIGMAGGFVGWELGTLDILQTDWRRLLAKSAIAGVAYFGAQQLLGAHGLFGSSVAFVASIGAAVMAEKIVDRLRKPDPADDLAARHEAWRKAVEDVLKESRRGSIVHAACAGVRAARRSIDSGGTMRHAIATGLALILAGAALAQRPSIPVQREWVDEADPATISELPMESRPWRFNQRTPRLVHTEERAGRRPVHYFSDVRWKQERDPKTGRYRAYYTTVRVDMEMATGAWACLKPFAPKWLAGHAALLLDMKPGGFTNLDGEDGGGFVLSFEALMRAGQSYSLIQGQRGKFPIIYVVSTWKDFQYKSIAMDTSVVQRWKLALPPEELINLELAIGRSVISDHKSERYNTLTHSCVTAALKLVNEAVPEPRRMKDRTFFGLLPNLEFSLPVLTDRALRKKGLIDGEMEEIEELR